MPSHSPAVTHTPHNQLPAWQSLKGRIAKAKNTPIRSLFDQDPDRFHKYSLKVQNLLLDFSKNPIDDETLLDLIQLAREAGLDDWRARMFHGDKINVTEHRAVLHTA